MTDPDPARHSTLGRVVMVVPTYNEVTNLAWIIGRLRRAQPEVDVLVVGGGIVGCGIARDAALRGLRVGLIRHPMPYHDLEAIRVQRFEAIADIDASNPTIEEREEYEPYIEAGIPVFAGVDYRAILAQAESEADVVLWDGGNNDYPFLRSDLSIVVRDALRPGHETRYVKGEKKRREEEGRGRNKI